MLVLVVLVLVVLARRVVPRVVRWWRAPVLRPSARQDGWSAPPRESSQRISQPFSLFSRRQLQRKMKLCL